MNGDVIAVHVGTEGCESSRPCHIGQGDCDSDTGCKGEVRCFKRSAGQLVPGLYFIPGFPVDTDICF